MYFYSNVFTDLAAKVRDGDFEAQMQLRQELQSVLVFMVRQTLRDGDSSTSIGRRILAVARRRLAAVGSVMTQGDEEFAREVADSLCEEVVARLQPCPAGSPVGESISNTAHGETVLLC